VARPNSGHFFFGAKAQSSRLSPAINILRLSRSQPMIAALIFRRQLVRRSPLYLQASYTADKLPLEKFHRLLDLAFWGEHQKISKSCKGFIADQHSLISAHDLVSQLLRLFFSQKFFEFFPRQTLFEMPRSYYGRSGRR